MKNLYFYGCSFTAGDELSDAEYPELCNHNDSDSYLRHRQIFFNDKMTLFMQYLEKNKSRAYPAKVAARGFDCKNFAENGASLEEMIAKIILHVSQGAKPDVVFLQPPVVGREAVFFNHSPCVDSISFNNFGAVKDRYNDYIKAKIMSFSDDYFAVRDLIELYMLKYFLDQKNIKLYLVEMIDELDARYCLATDEKLKAVVDTIKQIPTIHIDPITHATADAHCFGGHLSEKMHEIIADRIVALLG